MPRTSTLDGDDSMKMPGWILWVIALAVIVILLIFANPFFKIDQSERGVVLSFGAVSHVAQPGLGFRLPIINNVRKISIQSQKRVYGAETGLAVYSRDQQPAEVRLSVNYHVDPTKVAEVYARFGSEDNAVARLVDPRVYERFKDIFGQFNAITAVQERARLNAEIEAAIVSSIGESPLVIENIQIENIDFSDAYEASIEARMLAEVEVAKRRQNLETEKINAEIALTQATGRANSVKAESDAKAYATRVQGEAAADAIRARATALANNPLLVDLTRAERWNGVLPTTMLPDSTAAFLGTGPR